ncbi:hemolysin-type calcium binding protein related domain protein [Serratia sp. DD3]|nr:hemolysin-type calcium binding protein related domain protein [Serratia sp. DD3]
MIDSYDNNGGGIYAGKDKIVFGKEVTAEMVGYRRESNHLIITVGKQGAQVTINNYFAGAAYRTINRFEFADGTVWQDIRKTDRFVSDTTATTKITARQLTTEQNLVSADQSAAIASQVNSLISAMATFAPQGSSTSIIPDDFSNPANMMLTSSVA